MEKNRRCSAKESSVLSKRIDDAKRNQSIYSQISLNCYATEGYKTGYKQDAIIVFHLCFREVFCWYISSNKTESEESGKDAGLLRTKPRFFSVLVAQKSSSYWQELASQRVVSSMMVDWRAIVNLHVIGVLIYMNRLETRMNCMSERYVQLWQRCERQPNGESVHKVYRAVRFPSLSCSL